MKGEPDVGGSPSVDEGGATAAPVDLLVIAVKSSNLHMCKAIIEEHPDALSAMDSQDGATAAHWAALIGNLEVLTFLADAGAPLEATVATSGMAPIHWAST